MIKLGLKNKNITILTEEEIIKKGKERDEFHKKNNTEIYDEEYFKRLLKEPMPYKLFRLNELYQYDLNYIGCEITEDAYFDRIGQLPPVYFKYDIYEGFFVNECITENRFEHCFKHNNKYYCVIMDLQKNELKKWVEE